MGRADRSVRGVVLGSGRAKLCVPLAEREESMLRLAAQQAVAIPCDLVEWRADFFEGVESPVRRGEALRMIRAEVGDLPILVTCRALAEGGAAALAPSVRVDCLMDAVHSGCCDLVDIEQTAGEPWRDRVLHTAQACGVAVILSRHDRKGTPTVEKMREYFRGAQDAGADLAKLAVTPRVPADVLALLEAVDRARQELVIPLIAVSMGKLGLPSRVCGGMFGSAVTFGAGRRACASGQLPADVLRKILMLLEEGTGSR